jgi:hypothetical protein
MLAAGVEYRVKIQVLICANNLDVPRIQPQKPTLREAPGQNLLWGRITGGSQSSVFPRAPSPKVTAQKLNLGLTEPRSHRHAQGPDLY